jgi:CDP-paratose 2-epimerase
MKILITGICGFVGSSLATWFRNHVEGMEIIGLDNLIRPGSELNRNGLKALGISVRHGDVRNASDFESLPHVDWVIDAAANPSVLAGIDGTTSSRQLVEHNFLGTVNILEYCKRVRAGFFLLSTSRVYSVRTLASLPLRVEKGAFRLDEGKPWPAGISKKGIAVTCSCAAPISLYGSTKLASEVMALEYGETFGLPIWVNRCGVMAGAGQFGTAEQGIFSFWIHAYARKRPLKYIGFEGQGCQVRDAFHPDDLACLIHKQMHETGAACSRIINVGGGSENARSLAQLSAWCRDRFGEHEIGCDLIPRPYDLPWVVMDNEGAAKQFGWCPSRNMESIFLEIADHADKNKDWFERTQ